MFLFLRGIWDVRGWSPEALAGLVREGFCRGVARNEPHKGENPWKGRRLYGAQ